MIDPNTLGAQANALVEEHGQFRSKESRAALHDAFLELLVRAANAEALADDVAKSAAAMAVYSSRLEELATAVVEANNSGSVAPYGVALNELAAHLKEKP